MRSTLKADGKTKNNTKEREEGRKKSLLGKTKKTYKNY